MRQKIFQKLFRFIVWVIADVEIIGMENVPDTESFAIAANHIGRLDTEFVFAALDRTDFILPVAEKYQKNPLTRFVGYMMGVIWLDRFTTDFKAIREMMTRIKQGGVLVIAPEGTRSKTGELQEGKPGVAFLAARAGLEIVPVALSGTSDREVIDNLKHFRRSHFKAIGGKAFKLSSPKTEKHENQLQEHTDEIMCRIAMLLPEERRGFYKEHPRLKELLAQLGKY